MTLRLPSTVPRRDAEGSLYWTICNARHKEEPDWAPRRRIKQAGQPKTAKGAEQIW